MDSMLVKTTAMACKRLHVLIVGHTAPTLALMTAKLLLISFPHFLRLSSGYRRRVWQRRGRGRRQTTGRLMAYWTTVDKLIVKPIPLLPTSSPPPASPDSPRLYFLLFYKFNHFCRDNIGLDRESTRNRRQL